MVVAISSLSHAEKPLLYIVYGDDPGDELGSEVSRIGDVNQDGVDDFVAASAWDDTFLTNAGMVRVYSGSDGVVLYDVYGDSASNLFGSSVSGVGDVNGDSYPDFLVGSPWNDDNGSNAGLIRLFNGVDGSVIYTILGDSAGDDLGVSVSGAGDMNKDGYDDFIAGAYDVGMNGSQSGAAYVFSGFDGSKIFTVYGDTQFDRLGASVSGAGDINNDGYGDFLVGAISASENQYSATGMARVYSGLDGNILYSHYGVNPYDRLGSSVSGIGDINNDGYADYISGAPGDVNNEKGWARVYSGRNGSVLYQFEGESVGDQFGRSVEGVGDLNKDGYADFAIGSALHDSSTGLVKVYSGLNGDVLFIVRGDSEGDAFGYSIDAIGDVNADGYSDMVIGSHYSDVNGSYAGAVKVVSGRFSRSVKNDFTNDSRAGWIWKGEFNGMEARTRTWSLTFPTYAKHWTYPERTFPPEWPDQISWELETTGDFDGDGDADWLWRHDSEGRWKVWQIQNGIRYQQYELPIFDIALNWSVVGAMDTDKDGDDDVVLFNGSTGEVQIWEMENNILKKTHNVGSKSGFDVVRVGDFDADGDGDLLLHQQGLTQLRFWELENNALMQEILTSPTGLGFETRCTGDFDGDGDDDILLLDDENQVKYFEYENFVRQQQHFGAIQTNFSFYGCSDYDGDGNSDILWRRVSDNFNRAQLLNDFVTERSVFTNPFGGTNPALNGYGYEYRGNSN